MKDFRLTSFSVLYLAIRSVKDNSKTVLINMRYVPVHMSRGVDLVEEFGICIAFGGHCASVGFSTGKLYTSQLLKMHQCLS